MMPVRDMVIFPPQDDAVNSRTGKASVRALEDALARRQRKMFLSRSTMRTSMTPSRKKERTIDASARFEHCSELEATDGNSKFWSKV